MAWGRLDDQGNDNPKLLALSDAGWRMWGCGLIYCQAKLTDGFIPAPIIETFGVKAPNKKKVAAELCSILIPGKQSLWRKVPGGYQIHDYLDWNDSRDKVLKKREGAKDRQSRHRAKDGDGNGVSHASSNALQGEVTRYTERDKRSVPSSTTDPVLRTTEERTAAEERRSMLDVVHKPKASIWKRGVAITHKVMDEFPSSADWSHELKSRLKVQGIDYSGPGGDMQRPLYARLIDYVEGVRKRRAG